MPTDTEDDDRDDWIHEEAMADSLLALGIEKDNVKNSVAAMYNTKPDATFMEIYGGGSFSSEAEGARRSLNLNGVGSPGSPNNKARWHRLELQPSC